jgi:hypothetical protein
MSERVIQNGLAGVLTTQEWTDLSPAEFELGTKAEFSNGDVFRLVRATAAKTAGGVYMIDENWLVGSGVDTTATQDLAQALGIPEATSTAPTAINASATYTYFWIQTAGNFDTVLISEAVDDGDLAYTTATAGQLGDTNTTNIVQAMAFTAAASATSTTAFSSVELHVAMA